MARIRGEMGDGPWKTAVVPTISPRSCEGPPALPPGTPGISARARRWNRLPSQFSDAAANTYQFEQKGPSAIHEPGALPLYLVDSSSIW
jgi:hypothetical protein